MQGERPHCQIRRVEKVGVATPLIVPSFSSCGFPQVADIYDGMKDKLYGVCLVSALDLASGCIPADVTDEVNLVLIDSGMYEAKNSPCLQVDHCPSPTKGHWLRQQYLEIAGGIDGGGNVILVNYDRAETLQHQIMGATEDFAHALQAASDFLVKPELSSGLVNVAKLAKHAGELEQFDIVGITAREAGDSLVKRCSTVVMLRDAMGDAGLENPIHIFGAINPMEVLAYFFCGADIFDGLNWLRLAFRKYGSMAIEEAAFEEQNFNTDDCDLRMEQRILNLSFLYRLQESLHQYCSTNDLDVLAREFPFAVKAARTAELAGAVLSQE